MNRYPIFDLIIEDTKYSSTDYMSNQNWNDLVRESSEWQKPLFFVNSFSCFLAHRNQVYANVLADGICLIDGRPLALLANQSRGSNTYQLRGVDFFTKVLEDFAQQDKRQVLFGSTEETCKAIAAKIMNMQGKEVHYISPPVVTEEHLDYEFYAKEIAALKPDIVWVALGTPKQDIVSSKLVKMLDNVAVASVGAAFDFYSGLKDEAPLWVRRAYLEWLYRLAKEPRRLWKRYLLGNTGFLLDVTKWKIARMRVR